MGEDRSLTIAAQGLAAEKVLLDTLTSVLGRQGVHVALAPGENFVRRVGVCRTLSFPLEQGYLGPPTVELRAEGLPNVLHEVAHMVLAGVLDDDHGFDYRGIPYRLETAAGRAVLAEELAACVLSCSYLHRDPLAVDAWFGEQVDIQPVFFGMEDTPRMFWDQVERIADEHAEEMRATLRLAFERTRALLRFGNAPAALVEPPTRLTLHGLLQRRRVSPLAR